MVGKSKDRRVAALLALAGAVSPISGWHKFYLGQPGWGCLYLTLSLVNPWNPVPRIASLIEAVWYLFHSEGFEQGLSLPLEAGQARFPFSGIGSEANRSVQTAQQISAIGDALRELEELRQEGLISEYEFEQKRRQLLDAK
ncbi:SHOCT domain-containing protein [Leptolyngbya ohadii]|uniref:SHOCT domain-containing protein n=1 Tax=Leptolyngbya ohadii TaxID=1962290 RepID=UPI000B5A0455|nr:SHOCT domain-containing protein [Leptolyngbya ohadii]